VLAGCKNLYSRCATTRGEFQQARMQPLIEKQVRGQDSEHG